MLSCDKMAMQSCVCDCWSYDSDWVFLIGDKIYPNSDISIHLVIHYSYPCHIFVGAYDHVQYNLIIIINHIPSSNAEIQNIPELWHKLYVWFRFSKGVSTVISLEILQHFVKLGSWSVWYIACMSKFKCAPLLPHRLGGWTVWTGPVNHHAWSYMVVHGRSCVTSAQEWSFNLPVVLSHVADLRVELKPSQVNLLVAQVTHLSASARNLAISCSLLPPECFVSWVEPGVDECCHLVHSCVLIVVVNPVTFHGFHDLSYLHWHAYSHS